MKAARSTPDQHLTYAAAGVSLEDADTMEDLIGPLVRRTYSPRVMPSHGAFAGMFRLDFSEKLFQKRYRDPVLVSCTDGVGSKLLVAIRTNRLGTVGIDLVAMNVNDLICCGAEPLFFLDYIAVHKLEPERVAEIVRGVAAGCEEAGCALLGGETAEMPDMYRRGHFDLAGFAVGVVERERLIEPRLVRPGDVLIGLPSSGLHSNGYALARKALLKINGPSLDEPVRMLGESLADALLRPTRIYVKPVLDVLRHYRKQVMVTGLAHITGGGIGGNLPRILPPDCDALVHRGAWPVPPIFRLIQREGVAEDEMCRVFNMGVGFVLAVRPKSAAAVEKRLKRHDLEAFVIGRVKPGHGRVEFQ